MSHRELEHLVDQATALGDFRISSVEDRKWWMVPGSELPAFGLRRLHQLGAMSGWIVPFHRSSLREAVTSPPLVSVRVDDFPRADLSLDRFLAFDALMERYQIPYALGVTPFLRISPRTGALSAGEVAILGKLEARGVMLAQHGFTHIGRRWRGRATVELPIYSLAELREWIRRADAFFDDHGLSRPTVFIPPFDGISASCIQGLSGRYAIVTGGPASLSTLGPVAPAVRLGRVLYLPSYYPHMYATACYSRLGERLWTSATGPVVVLAIHWAWEVRDRFRRLERLLAALESRVSPWPAILGRFGVLHTFPTSDRGLVG
jgi:hypothetical protein